MPGTDFDELAFFRAIHVQIPARDDLIQIKRFVDRPKGLEDIRLLRSLDSEDGRE